MSDLVVSRINQLSQIILSEHDAVVAAGQSMVEHAIHAGEALLEAKSLIPRGQWSEWLATNIPLSASVPNVYMRIAKYVEVVRAGNPPTIKAARRMLIGLDEPGKLHFASDEEREIIKRDAQPLRAQGMSYKQIGIELGVPAHWVNQLLSPAAQKRRLALAKRRSVAARGALAREERRKAVARAGGKLEEAYSLIRRALQIVDGYAAQSEQGKKYRNEALHRLMDAEERISHAAKHESIHTSS